MNCIAQQTIAVNNAVHINLPDKAVKISKDQALLHATKKFHYDKTKLNSITDRNADIYKIDNILISLNAQSNGVKEGHLLALKKGFDEMFKGDKTYSSNLKKVNNNSVLILNHIIGTTERYQFICFNTDNSRSIGAILEFDKSDASEAKIILDQLINSIKFTK